MQKKGGRKILLRGEKIWRSLKEKWKEKDDRFGNQL